ncbi:IclR family transcriptional regulator [Pseudomonas sp. S32]|uniref:IclR family transcriptional regulator n=1 Tax=Pseudomonas sp. S32 TaxID=2767448 RepID=UPI001911FE14|nr:helix-turn-helix domain-containing protein [Pseudomonas sp. S32]MBK5006931.1 helix-turn-helix domain-containing protein [Pseudomonas sp. S32]
MEPSNQAGTNDERGGGIQVIARAAKILNLLGKRPDGLSLGEIAQEVGFPRSTVQRIVGALEEEGMIRSEGVGGIRLGAGLLRLVTHAHADRITIVQPWLQKLSGSAQETAVLSRADGLRLLVEYRVVADRELQVMPRLGLLDLPLHGTSAGRALLALEDDDKIRDMMVGATAASRPLDDRIFQQLNTIRQLGFSCDHGELMEGITTTAIALDTVLGCFAISMPIPTFRFERDPNRYTDALLECKAGLTSEIGVERGW